MQSYKIDILNYRENGSVKSNCSDITFANTGNTTLTINGALTLAPGQSISFNANYNEIDQTIYYYSFPANVGSVTIFRKIYI